MKNALLFGLLSLFFLFACNTAKQQNSENTTSSETSSEIYFKATGNEPFWGLNISETEIQLKSLADDKTYTFTHTAPIKAMDANMKLYRTENTEAKIEITIEQSECINDMSGEALPYTATIRLEKKNGRPENYKGCGKYQLPVRLHDIWALHELNGKPVTPSDFAKEIPYLEMNSETNKYMGYAGCNRISGQLFYEPGVLRFTKGISTLMACGGTNKENEFLTALNKVTQYEFKERYVWLSNPSGVLVVLKKVD